MQKKWQVKQVKNSCDGDQFVSLSELLPAGSSVFEHVRCGIVTGWEFGVRSRSARNQRKAILRYPELPHHNVVNDAANFSFGCLWVGR